MCIDGPLICSLCKVSYCKTFQSKPCPFALPIIEDAYSVVYRRTMIGTVTYFTFDECTHAALLSYLLLWSPVDANINQTE